MNGAGAVPVSVMEHLLGFFLPCVDENWTQMYTQVKVLLYKRNTKYSSYREYNVI